VQSHGFIPEEQYPEFVASMDIVIHPSKRDCFSLTVLEALSSGTPVIARPIEPTRQVDSKIYFAGTTDEYIDKIKDVKHLLRHSSISQTIRSSVQNYSKKEIIDRLEDRLT
jgi:Glycosyltransferase